MNTRQRQSTSGFTLIELLIVIAIIALLASVVIPMLWTAVEKARMAKAQSEFNSITKAVELYYQDNGQTYPPNAAPGTAPTGLTKYINNGVWPNGPWPGSVYDWDNWADPDNPGQQIYQISIRFCPTGGTLAQCHFPKEIWATNFNVDSALYYCIDGACRSDVTEPTTYPGYCVNCAN